jgi:hypothetical protein
MTSGLHSSTDRFLNTSVAKKVELKFTSTDCGLCCIDTLEFSSYPSLLHKIQEIASQTRWGNAGLYFAEESASLKGRCEIWANEYPLFFEAVFQLQRYGEDIVISKDMLTRTLTALCRHRYMQRDEMQMWKSKIKTSLTTAEYEKKVQDTHDFSKALQLALHYRNRVSLGFNDERSALSWLCMTKDFLGEEKLGMLVDLQEFFLPFQSIEMKQLFTPGYEEILGAAVNSCSLRKLSFEPFSYYSQEELQRVGVLLGQTQSIQEVVLRQPLSSCFYDITPIAEALKINTSIQSLRIELMHIDDCGVKKILEAIESNSRSAIKFLSFSFCGATNSSAYRVIGFKKRNKKIAIAMRDFGIALELALKVDNL